jgi:predicted permease
VLVAHVALSPAVLQSPAKARAAWEDVLDRARRFPGVQSVALADVVPMRVGEDSVGYWATPVQPPPDQTPLALTSIVTPDFLKVMGIPLRQGRFLNEQDRAGHEIAAVIDDNLAQHAFGGGDPVGKPLWLQGMGSEPVRIVGVVGHVRHWGLAGDDQSRVRDQIYVSFYQLPDPLVHFLSSVMSITVRTNISPLSVAEPLRRELRGPGGDQTLYDVHTMDDLASASLDRQRFLLWLFGIFAGLALLLACIGIYGVLTYLTNQRVPEIGLRMALGANARNVIRLVLRQSFGMIVVGVGVGMLGALAAGHLLEHLVEGMRPADLSAFAITIPILLAAALFASFIPARRASRVDPMSALRQE